MGSEPFQFCSGMILPIIILPKHSGVFSQP